MQGQRGSRERVALPALVSEADIAEHVRRLAKAIARDCADGEVLCVVAVMKGALVFLADLVRHLPMPLEIELVNVRSYGGTRRREEVNVLDDMRSLSLTGRHVLLLDCVLDSGETLKALQREIGACAPASLKTCVLLRKARPRTAGLEPEYVGLDIPDVFVVGYGLDYQNRWRHLPYVAELAGARLSGDDAP
jgi:hypoxanthine phosphoribosyltransferase